MNHPTSWSSARVSATFDTPEVASRVAVTMMSLGCVKVPIGGPEGTSAVAADTEGSDGVADVLDVCGDSESADGAVSPENGVLPPHAVKSVTTDAITRACHRGIRHRMTHLLKNNAPHVVEN